MELIGLQYIQIIQGEDINLLNSPIKRFAKTANIYIEPFSQFVKYGNFPKVDYLPTQKFWETNLITIAK